MAKRPIFIPITEGHLFFKEVDIEFIWHPGFAPIQKKKNIAAMHESAAQRGFSKVLEVSTKSDDILGKRLSAFNLPIQLEDGARVTLECAFQGSKVFENGGPFTDIYLKSSREAKKDQRLRENGKIVRFKFERFQFPAEPKTAFYDWLYLRALSRCQKDIERLNKFDGFTDIEFNPEKSINCQARSCAIIVSLMNKNLLDDVHQSPERFIETIYSDAQYQLYSKNFRQARLF